MSYNRNKGMSNGWVIINILTGEHLNRYSQYSSRHLSGSTTTYGFKNPGISHKPIRPYLQVQSEVATFSTLKDTIAIFSEWVNCSNAEVHEYQFCLLNKEHEIITSVNPQSRFLYNPYSAQEKMCD
jgi:hypothetical protein